MKNPAPCKDCGNRCIGCQGNCEAYRAFRSEHMQQKAERRKDNILTAYTREKTFRCRAQAPSGKRHVKAR